MKSYLGVSLIFFVALPLGAVSLHEGVDSGNLEIVRQELNKGADPNESGNDPYTLPSIHLLAGQSFPIQTKAEILDELLSHGASLEQTSDLGHRPLHEAVLRGDKDFVILLLDRGADVNAVWEAAESTAMDIAIDKEFPDLIRLITDAGGRKYVGLSADSPVMLDIRDPKFLIVTALTLLVVFIVMALAQRKQRNIWLWGAATLASVFLALIALAFFGYLNRMDAEAQRRSRRRELITCSILILLGVGRFARLLMHAF